MDGEMSLRHFKRITSVKLDSAKMKSELGYNEHVRTPVSVRKHIVRGDSARGSVGSMVRLYQRFHCDPADIRSRCGRLQQGVRSYRRQIQTVRSAVEKDLSSLRDCEAAVCALEALVITTRLPTINELVWNDVAELEGQISNSNDDVSTPTSDRMALQEDSSVFNDNLPALQLH